MPMVIGVCTFELYLEGIHSFNVSVAEVGALDSWQRCSLAVAVVSNDRRFANQVLSKVSQLVASNGEIMLIDQEMSFL